MPWNIFFARWEKFNLTFVSDTDFRPYLIILFECSSLFKNKNVLKIIIKS